MPTKRTYTLSEAAKQQRRLASRSAQAKRGIKPLRANKIVISDFADLFAPLPKDAPNSEHQSRAARIRVHMLKTGAISGSSRGGRRHVPRPCPRCNVECSTAREARDHCRLARAK
jgi:hypothetical protein